MIRRFLRFPDLFPDLFSKGLIRVRAFAASSAHKGLWLAEEMSADTLNHALTMWDVDGELDAAVMESAFLHVLAEAEVLRVTFADTGDGLRLTPRELGDWRPFHLDLSAAADPEQAAREALADLIRKPFDLGADLLFRMGVITLAPDRSLVVIAYHHLVSDGFGTGGLLSQRLAEVYTALVRGQEVPAPPHPWDAESFTAEAADYLASPRFTEDTGFWRDYLADAPAPARIPRVALGDTERAALAAPLSSADRWGELTEPIGMVSRTLTVPRAEADTWTEAAKAMGVWTSTMLTAAAAVYVRHRCDRPEFLLSLAVGNRSGVASRTPGLAVNVVPVRVKVPLDATFTDLADAIVDETYEISGHTACHYSDIQRASGAALSDRGSFGAVMNVVEFVEQLRFGDLPARYLGGTTGSFGELSIGVYTDGSADSDLFIRLDAPASLYDRAELRFIGEELTAHIRAVVADGELPAGAADTLTGAGRERVLTAPNGTDTPLTSLTVPQLFARQVQSTPDAVALQSGGLTLTYRDLDERSGRLAEVLRGRGVGPDTVVAVALERSPDLAVALLATAKAGGAHLPLDPALPAAQVERAAGDAAAHVLLTDAATARTLSTGLRTPALVLTDHTATTGDDTTETAPTGADGTATGAVTGAGATAAAGTATGAVTGAGATAIDGTATAAVTGAGATAADGTATAAVTGAGATAADSTESAASTDGTASAEVPATRASAEAAATPAPAAPGDLTPGAPHTYPHPDNLLALAPASPAAGAVAAVGVTHRDLARLALDRTWRDAARGAVLWHTPAASDTLALELWAPLLNGGRVVVAPPGELDADALTRARTAHDLTAVWLPAALFTAIAARRPAALAGLRQVLTGGDRVPAVALRRVREACPELTVVTGHGPAEAGLFAVAGHLAAHAPQHRAGTLGRPADNTRLYVLGPGLAPVPASVTGELYVAGPGLARGYLRRPAPTAERFVPCPFGPPGTRMYRTGDRVRWGADGWIEHVADAGTQADVRGAAVDPAEVEEVLCEHPALAGAVVAVRPDDTGQQRPVAYVVPVEGRAVPVDELRRFAAGRLPESVVPALFTVLERLPVTAAGRVDRAALPEPVTEPDTYRAPRNDTERILAQAFAEVLEVDRVGIDEDFFDLGGNSLRAIRLVGLIRAELKQEVSIRRLFAARTVIGLSDMWKDLGRSSRPSLRRRTKEGAVL
ncbi:AMP-binding protein [Streptomyces sp. NPDC127038]|uniref:AMP-binding protein n=1 Tax=Streptomyces sp. NPDC127038 TaxID=3347114 RepID=UPI0036685AFB